MKICEEPWREQTKRVECVSAPTAFQLTSARQPQTKPSLPMGAIRPAPSALCLSVIRGLPALSRTGACNDKKMGVFNACARSFALFKREVDAGSMLQLLLIIRGILDTYVVPLLDPFQWRV
jgi:hypothetical protein